MKRITYWPQFFLGLTFNWGIIMASAAMNNAISVEIILLYLAAIFWTLGYDTIYGTQDMSEDEIIGLKSTSIKFKNNIKFFVSSCYILSSILIFFSLKNNLGMNILLLFLILFIMSLIFQILKFKVNNPKTCLDAFKTNNISGLFLFLAITSSSL